MNICTTCGEDFGSVSAFDAHRVGRYLQSGPAEYTGQLAAWSPDRGRRCLTVSELLERGWTRDGRGRWRQPSQGAPWASSQDQAMTLRGPQAPGKRPGRRKPLDRSAPLPDSREGTGRK